MKKIGVIGCGLMGQGIVKNLLKNGYIVSIHDINKEAVGKLVEKGAVRSENVKKLAEEVDCLILSLPSPALIQKLLLEEDDGALQAMRPETSIIDMSTNDVQLTRHLHEKAQERKIEYFDCPLSGGPAGAEAGTLTIMVGGNEKAFASIQDVLKAVGENIDYVGPSGAGQTVKLCNNMVVAGVITLLSEAMLTGEKAGISKEKIAAILQKGSAQTKVMDVFGPNILQETFEDVKFSLANMTKDLQLYKNLAEQNQIPTFSSQNTNQLFNIANNKGSGSKDSTAVHEIIEALAT
ncbi:NAD(P)-dependent oxidoreductase [Virgibacillus sp. W0181]|uniref:NAD(P)-dependent oxidoreductase n=1 Tax=Virgibacillus sp. W0181 TaxID=3391581 RepID=UPI003F46B590